ATSGQSARGISPRFSQSRANGAIFSAPKSRAIAKIASCSAESAKSIPSSPRRPAAALDPRPPPLPVPALPLEEPAPDGLLPRRLQRPPCLFQMRDVVHLPVDPDRPQP